MLKLLTKDPSWNSYDWHSAFHHWSWVNIDLFFARNFKLLVVSRSIYYNILKSLILRYVIYSHMFIDVWRLFIIEPFFYGSLCKCIQVVFRFGLLFISFRCYFWVLFWFFEISSITSVSVLLLVICNNETWALSFELHFVVYSVYSSSQSYFWF